MDTSQDYTTTPMNEISQHQFSLASTVLRQYRALAILQVFELAPPQHPLLIRWSPFCPVHPFLLSHLLCLSLQRFLDRKNLASQEPADQPSSLLDLVVRADPVSRLYHTLCRKTVMRA